MSLDTRIVVQGDDTIISRTQDCVPIAEFAQRQHNAGHHGSSEMRHAASIPNVIVEQYCNDNNVIFSEVMGDPEHIRRICNDPKNAMFRIWPGKL